MEKREIKYKFTNAISWQIEKSQEFIYILNHASGQYYELEEVGKVGKDIWFLIQQQITVEEMITDLMKKYKIERESLSADIEELLKALVAENLISPIY